MKRIAILLSLALTLGPGTSWAQALRELQGAGGEPEAPPAIGETRETPQAPSQDPKPTIVCTMSFVYAETETRLPILPVIRLWKELDGTAKLACPGREPVRLKMHAEGLSLGLTAGAFTKTNEGVAGSIDIRVPTAFQRRDLEGSYVQIGGEIGGVGAGVSPWTNKDAAFSMVIYLPTSFNASAAINLQTLELYLLASDVDW
ncbi:MAG: hypothetical protein HY553_07195 [Elusimicrobia bacterium]|nr:hypothetical protein [Elusimicrobiota bacterium]